MAFTGTRRTDSNSAAIQPSVANVIKLYEDVETPVLSRVGDASRDATQPIHSWFRDETVLDHDLMNDAGGISNADTTMVVTNGVRFNVNSLLQVEDEVILVTAVATNSLTITRGYGGTTAASHADGSLIRIIADGNYEGADVQGTVSRSRTLMTNYAHVIEPRANQISVADQASLKYNGVDESEHQMAMLLIEGMRQLENAALYSIKHSSTPAGSGSVLRTMDGLWRWPSTNVLAAAGSVLTEDYLNTQLATWYGNGAVGIDTIVVPYQQKRRIDKFAGSARRMEMSSSGVSMVVNEYEHSFSTKPLLRIILHRRMNGDHLLAFDSDMVGMAPFVPFARKKLAEAGFYSKEGIHGEYALEVHNELAVGKISGLSTT